MRAPTSLVLISAFWIAWSPPSLSRQTDLSPRGPSAEISILGGIVKVKKTVIFDVEKTYHVATPDVKRFNSSLIDSQEHASKKSFKLTPIQNLSGTFGGLFNLELPTRGQPIESLSVSQNAVVTGPTLTKNVDYTENDDVAKIHYVSQRIGKSKVFVSAKYKNGDTETFMFDAYSRLDASEIVRVKPYMFDPMLTNVGSTFAIQPTVDLKRGPKDVPVGNATDVTIVDSGGGAISLTGNTVTARAQGTAVVSVGVAGKKATLTIKVLP